MSAARFAVTGASGGLGSAIVRGLLAAGVPAKSIRALSRDPRAVKRKLGTKAKRFDYDDAKSVSKGLKGVGTLMLISTWDFDRRKDQHARIIAAAKARGVKRIVYASAVSPGEQDHLTGAHPATERMLRESGLRWTAVRATLYMSLFEGDIRSAGQRGEHVTSVGKAKAAFVDRDDLARADVAVLLAGTEHDGKAYTITGPTSVSAEDFAALAGKLSGKKVKVRNLSRPKAADALRAAGMSEGDIGITLGLEDEIRSGLIAKVSPDLKRLVGDSGTSFEDAMRRALT